MNINLTLTKLQARVALENYLATYNPLAYSDVLNELLNKDDISQEIITGLMYSGCDRPYVNVGNAESIYKIINKYFS